jgi:hypothetical protein
VKGTVKGWPAFVLLLLVVLGLLDVIQRMLSLVF